MIRMGNIYKILSLFSVFMVYKMSNQKAIYWTNERNFNQDFMILLHSVKLSFKNLPHFDPHNKTNDENCSLNESIGLPKNVCFQIVLRCNTSTVIQIELIIYRWSLNDEDKVYLYPSFPIPP